MIFLQIYHLKVLVSALFICFLLLIELLVLVALKLFGVLLILFILMRLIVNIWMNVIPLIIGKFELILLMIALDRFIRLFCSLTCIVDVILGM